MIPASTLPDRLPATDRMPSLRLLTASAGRDGARSEEPVRVPLLRLDPDFGEVIPVEDHALAEAALRLAVLTLPPGPGCAPSAVPGARAYLVTDGLLSRNVWVAGRSMPELFGAGDVIDGSDLGDDPGEDGVAWAVHQPTRIVVLDDRFALAARRWPGLWQVLLRRATARAGRLAAHLATMQLSRVEDRVERILWQLADRWGRVTPEGVVLPVSFTHEALGLLVGAKRPTVSLALTTLCDRGSVVRRIDGSWLLVAGR